MSAATTLTSPPSLLPLYAKAARHRRRCTVATTLPDSRYTLADQAIDPEHLAAYQRVCGFRTTDVLPPTYLHVLAFPVTVALMTEPAFPFPLIGLVHVANSITVARPVRSDERSPSTCGPPTCVRTRPGGSSTCWSMPPSTARRCGRAARPTCAAAARRRRSPAIGEGAGRACRPAGRAGAGARRHRPPLRRGVRRPQPDPPAAA